MCFPNDKTKEEKKSLLYNIQFKNYHGLGKYRFITSTIFEYLNNKNVIKTILLQINERNVYERALYI